MIQPCELVMAKIMPMVRALVVNTLLDEYGLKQTEVSGILGITQPSVSHYRTRKRAYDEEVLILFPELRDYARELARTLMTEKDSDTPMSHFCDVCKHLRGSEKFCTIHKTATELGDCRVYQED